LYAAAAVELLHNFSLIHDDIQDNSPVRHNRPTVWKLWGQANAINTGDILFSLAFVALQNLANSGIEPQHLIKIWEIFNFTNLELTRGQHLDMQFESRDAVSIDEYISMISGKSAALLAACAQIGSYIASGDHYTAERFAEYALNLGIAFQIHDDILGIWGDADVTGKSTATDIVSKKKSLPVLYGLTSSEELRQIYAQDELSQSDVEKAVGLLDSVGAQEYTRSMEARYYNHALETLEKVAPQGEAAGWLRQFTTALFERRS
jgi:geranylgeranyl diphosphate synthase type I